MATESYCFCAVCGGPLDEFAFPHDRFDHGDHNEIQEVWIKDVWVIMQDYARNGSFIRVQISGKGRYCGQHDWVGTYPGSRGYREFYRLYRDLDMRKPAFPLHWPCYELLHLVLFDGRDVSQPDMDALFNTLQSLTAYSATHLQLDYGLGGEGRRYSHWTPRLEQDWSLADPSRSEETKSYLLDVLSGSDFTLSNPACDLVTKVVCDLFSRLPLEIIHMIVSHLGLTDVLNLSSASWIVNVQLRADQRFWWLRLKYELLPFYLELGEFVRKEAALLQRHHPKDLCVWIHWSTSPETGDGSPIPGVVNRRRIWNTCLQLKELHQRYTATLPSEETTTVSPFTEFGSDSLVAGFTYRIAWPFPLPSAADSRPESYRPLLHSWGNLASSKHLVRVAWHPDKSLGTICVIPCPENTSVEESPGSEISRGDWIRQLILHIPAFDARCHEACPYTILPRGLTIVLTSGKELRFGEADKGHYMRPLVTSREEVMIVGLYCRYGLVYGHKRAVYYNVVDALRPAHNHDQSQADGNHAQHASLIWVEGTEWERLAHYLWKSDYREMLGGVRIWDFPGLRLTPTHDSFTWYSKRENPLPLAVEALVWATTAADFGRLTRLSACFPKDGVAICALKVESGPVGSGGALVCQTVGSNQLRGAQWHTFEVNGAVGEFITKVVVYKESRSPCRALKIKTNYKETIWGSPGGDFKRSIKAPAGGRLVGLMGIFGKPGWQHVDQGLSALAGLSMAL
ncbi:hypothetical protein PG991_000727 [Apiospora marii]|uniref:F-box domain-containing protein n=1 Tax=Apiospora marii TaxID=335849 RepID=A0ABR1SST4_9PEZI